MKTRIVIVSGCIALIAVVLAMGSDRHGIGISGWIAISCMVIGIGCEMWEYVLDRADRKIAEDQDVTPATGITVLTYPEDGDR